MITPQDAFELIKDEKYHKFYKQACQYALDLAIHADEEPPGELLTARRPKESNDIKKYRETIYIHKTEAPIAKVRTSLMKIRKSQDWMIKYKDEENSRIVAEESLRTYTEKTFPKYQSFTNWFFDVCFNQYLIDANAVAFIMPNNLKETGGSYAIGEGNEYLRPYPVIYNSHQVLNYSSEYYLLHSAEKSTYQHKGRTYDDGEIYYLIDKQVIYELRQSSPKPDFDVIEYRHDLGVLPVVSLNGMVKKEMRELCLYKSRISPMVPELKEALREYSDLQAEVVQHLHSTLWTKAPQKCTNCNGIGKVIGKTKAQINCPSCKGKGTFPFNPYEVMEVREPKAGETGITGEPAGFIQKQTEIVKIQNERVQDHIYYSYASIGFEFLMSTPLNQSGTAKAYDRSEIDNFSHSVAEDVVRIIDRCYFIFGEYRHRVIVPNAQDRKELLPYIPVPQKYDILSEQFTLDEVTKLKTANIDTGIINATLIDYANKKFGNDEDMKNFVVSCIILDPFASENEDALLMKLQNGGISKEAYTVHCNIKTFVKRAVEKDENFYSLSFADKTKVIIDFAKEMIKENSASAKVLSMVNPVNEDDEIGGG